jgi:hypothetical protein
LTGSVPVGEQSICDAGIRADYLREQCLRRELDQESINWSRAERNLLVDDQHRIIYCDIPKCGSKSFKHYLGTLASPDFSMGLVVDMRRYFNATGIRIMSTLSEHEREIVLRDYFKFIVVRHPLDRLRSAWQHKLSEPGKSHALRGMEGMVNRHLKSADPSRNTSFNFIDEYLAFEPFLEMIHLNTDAGFKNAHWATYYDLCQPCHIQYDHVIKLETLSRDMEGIYDHLRKLNSDDVIPEITHDNKVRPSDGIDKLKSINQVYHNINTETLNGLVRVYGQDFLLFGYNWDNTSGATCVFKDHDCC